MSGQRLAAEAGLLIAVVVGGRRQHRRQAHLRQCAAHCRTFAKRVVLIAQSSNGYTAFLARDASESRAVVVGVFANHAVRLRHLGHSVGVARRVTGCNINAAEVK